MAVTTTSTTSARTRGIEPGSPKAKPGSRVTGAYSSSSSSSNDRVGRSRKTAARDRVGRVIDLHTHILPGLDDGARTLEESVAMARSAVADGIRVVAATPHVRDDYPTRAIEMEQGLAQVREALALEGIALEVLPGGEIALDRL